MYGRFIFFFISDPCYTKKACYLTNETGFKLIPVIFITIIFIKNENKTIEGGKQT